MIESNMLIELRADTFSIQGVVVSLDDEYLWLAEALIYQAGIPIRDSLIKTLMRVRRNSIRAVAKLQSTVLGLDYSTIATLPEPGCCVSVLIEGEQLNGIVVAHDPLQIKDQNGRGWLLTNPDILDALIDRRRARMLIAAASGTRPIR